GQNEAVVIDGLSVLQGGDVVVGRQLVLKERHGARTTPVDRVGLKSAVPIVVGHDRTDDLTGVVDVGGTAAVLGKAVGEGADGIVAAPNKVDLSRGVA